MKSTITSRTRIYKGCVQITFKQTSDDPNVLVIFNVVINLG